MTTGRGFEERLALTWHVQWPARGWGRYPVLWEARSSKSCKYHSLQWINLTFDLRALSASCCKLSFDVPTVISSLSTFCLSAIMSSSACEILSSVLRSQVSPDAINWFNHVASLFGKVLFQGVNCSFESPALASLATLLALVMALSATSLFFGDSLDGCRPGLLVFGGIAPDILIKSFA